MDTSGPYPTSLGGSEYWFLAVDDFTRYKISGFAKKKSEIGDFMKEVLSRVRIAGHSTEFVRCDNAGENIKQLKEACEVVNGLQMEYTAP